MGLCCVPFLLPEWAPNRLSSWDSVYFRSSWSCSIRFWGSNSFEAKAEFRAENFRFAPLSFAFGPAFDVVVAAAAVVVVLFSSLRLRF